MASADMRGDWAGEIGQTQFLPSSYVQYAVNFDGRGHADLIRSPADVLASTANYLKSHGWQRGQGWDQGQPNFAVIQEWNKAEVYAKTIALFADKLDGGRSIKTAETEQPKKRAPSRRCTPSARAARRKFQDQLLSPGLAPGDFISCRTVRAGSRISAR